MDMLSNDVMHGYIITYFPEKGYGFICDDDDTDEYFFHISEIKHPFEIVPDKTRVEFTVKENQKGVYATNIKKYIPKIEGKFGDLKLPYNKKLLSNKECYEYISSKHTMLQKVLEVLSENDSGINTSTLKTGWISVDAFDYLDEIEDIKPQDGAWENIAPSGYPDTFTALFEMLQDQINRFNKQYIIAKKGWEGENKTHDSLKSIAINYPTLYNILLEEGTDGNTFSAETDTLIITDRGIFIVETKNYGGKKDTITISSDGRWNVFDGYKKISHVIENNPFKQLTDHIFVIKKFLEKNNFDTNIALIPVVALSNNEVKIENDTGEDMPRVIRTDMVGTFVLNYLGSHESVLEKETMAALEKAFTDTSLPPKKYYIVDYFENIECVCQALEEVLKAYFSDLEKMKKPILESDEVKEESTDTAKETESYNEESQTVGEKLVDFAIDAISSPVVGVAKAVLEYLWEHL